MKPDMKIPLHRGDKFWWFKGEGGVAEASDLDRPIHGRVWSDACDIGFFIESHKTGERKLFTLVNDQRGWDGDVEYWTYRSEDGIVVKVYND